MNRDSWRLGNQVPINVYEGDRAVCQCHNPEDATRIVEAVNRMTEFKRIHDECHTQRDEARAEVDRLEFELMTERRKAQGPGLFTK